MTRKSAAQPKHRKAVPILRQCRKASGSRRERVSSIFKKEIHLADLRTKRVKTRLVVAIPILLVIVAVGSVLTSLFILQGAGPEEGADLIKKQAVIGGIGAAILGICLALLITLPIRKLTKGLQRISAGDYLAHALDISSEDEIGRLGKAYQDMITSLNEHILSSMTGGVITINRDGIITTFNTAAEAILGYGSREVAGKRLEEIFPEGEENKKMSSIISSALNEGKTFSSGEIRVRPKRKQPLSIGITTSLLKDKQGILLGVVVTFKNLADIKRLEEQMRRADKLAALGSLAAGVAHEIRNPLGSVKGLAQLLQEGLDREGTMRSYARTIVREVDRLDKVVQELLSFAQPHDKEFEAQATDLGKVIDEALLLARHDIAQDKIKVIREYKEDLPPLYADPMRLQQAFLNLMLNAFQAMPEGGELRISTGTREKKRPVPLDRHARVLQAKHLTGPGRAIGEEGEEFVEVQFSDSGEGISPEDMKRLFDPFFTTRKDGSGLGLAITHQIVSAHYGYIDVDSQPGKGTTFTVGLPLGRSGG